MDSYYFRFIYNLFHEILFLTFFIFVITCGYSQKNYKFTTDNITIDGKLDEPYGNPPEATNFIMSSLIMGDQFPKIKNNRKVIYDNDAIYVAALLYDDEPDRLEISQRDSFGISDVLAFSSMALMMVSKISSFLSTLLMDNQTA
jgi:hypothetical protein